MKLVYICSPLSGDMDLNKMKANEYCACAAKAGVIPLAPHTIFTQYLDDDIPSQRRQGLKMGLELLRRCDELWVCGDAISNGMRNEILYAHDHGIPTRYLSDRKVGRDPPDVQTQKQIFSLAEKLRTTESERKGPQNRSVPRVRQERGR